MPSPLEGDRLLTPSEVARLFRVDPKTVTRWAAAGRIGSVKTPGGHRRYWESEVKELLEDVRRAGAAPLHRGGSGYSFDLDRDRDGTACER